MVEKLSDVLEKEARKSLARRDFPLGKGKNTKATVYVPSTRFATPIDKNEFNERIKTVQRFLTTTFGGTTRISGYGTYTSEGGQFIGEGIAKVEVFCDYGTWLMHDQDLERWLLDKKVEWNQESISFEFQSPKDQHATLHFV